MLGGQLSPRLSTNKTISPQLMTLLERDHSTPRLSPKPAINTHTMTMPTQVPLHRFHAGTVLLVVAAMIP